MQIKSVKTLDGAMILFTCPKYTRISFMLFKQSSPISCTPFLILPQNLYE